MNCFFYESGVNFIHMKQEVVEKILRETEDGYDLVADKFSETRKYFWPELEFIKNYANSGDKIMDFGCGNGRLLEIIPSDEIDYYGLDISQKLLNIARQKYTKENIHFQKISCLESLPFADNFFNIIYAIAVFHHLPGQELRQQTSRELFRVLKPGGIMFVTVWNLWQKKYWKNVLLQWVARMSGRNKLDWNDCHVEFRDNRGNVFSRYHHAFTATEMGKLFCSAGFRSRKCKVFDKRNIVLMAQKPSLVKKNKL